VGASFLRLFSEDVSESAGAGRTALGVVSLDSSFVGDRKQDGVEAVALRFVGDTMGLLAFPYIAALLKDFDASDNGILTAATRAERLGAMVRCWYGGAWAD